MKGAWTAMLLLVVACGDDTAGPDDGPAPTRSEAASAVTQTGTVGAVVADPVAVLVTDDEGSPVSGATVNWVVVTGGGSLAGGTTTDDAGIARAVWTLGTAVGENVIEARVGTLPAISFTATAEAGPAARLATDQQSILFDLPIDSLQLTAVVQDEYGNALDVAHAVWSSSDEAVVSVDEDGWVRVVGGGTATISAAVGSLSAAIPTQVDIPKFTVPFVDLDLVIDFMAFGAPLSPVHDNVAYEVLMDDDSMEVRSVSTGIVERVYYQADTEDYELFVQYDDNWLVLYDHLVDPRLDVGDDVQPGDVIGLVQYFGNRQIGMDLVPMGRIELQVNHIPSGMAWCPALFGTDEFNLAHDAALARVSVEPSTCRKPTAQP